MAGIDIHSAIGKLPKPKQGWTLPGHYYTGQYNPLEQQVNYDPETEQVRLKSAVHGEAHARAERLINKLYGSTLNSN